MTDDSREREAFHKWASAHWIPEAFARCEGGDYENTHIDWAWMAWEARARGAGEPEGWRDALNRAHAALNEAQDEIHDTETRGIVGRAIEAIDNALHPSKPAPQASTTKEGEEKHEPVAAHWSQEAIDALKRELPEPKAAEASTRAEEKGRPGWVKMVGNWREPIVREVVRWEGHKPVVHLIADGGKPIDEEATLDRHEWQPASPPADAQGGGGEGVGPRERAFVLELARLQIGTTSIDAVKKAARAIFQEPK